MSLGTRGITEWLNRPQRTRGDDLLVAIVGAAVLWGLGWLINKALEALGLISLDNKVPIWAAAIAGGLLVALGVVVGRRSYVLVPQRHQLFSEHIGDALADLRRVNAGELPEFSLRDYVENGLFQPAHDLLVAHGRKRGEVRFSVLHPDAAGVNLTMSSGGTLHPAFGHSMEARNQFSIPIDGSFSGLAYRSGRAHYSNDLKNDDRWTRHPRARQGREYESIVSVPLVLGGEIDGVLNVIAQRRGAFDRVDQTYITLLGSVIDVGRSSEEA